MFYEYFNIYTDRYCHYFVKRDNYKSGPTLFMVVLEVLPQAL